MFVCYNAIKNKSIIIYYNLTIEMFVCLLLEEYAIFSLSACWKPWKNRFER